MLYWAIFLVGYFLGVFFALKFLLEEDNNQGYKVKVFKQFKR